MFRNILATSCALLMTTFFAGDLEANETAFPLVINEIMASNSSSIRDPQGEYEDWIEIYNYGNEAMDIAGMYLTDDLSVPTQWRVPDSRPAETTIPAGGYLLIWADNDTTDAGLHANFKLDADGEEIALFDVDRVTLIDSIIFGDQTTDISYGRYPDAGDTQRFFATPSPAARNHDAYPGVVEPPQFSHERGFYDRLFYVTIATETEGATIYYTLDGSRPYDTSKGRGVPLGTIYTGPIRIATTTCLRVEAIKHGWKPHEVVTHTYIFPNDVLLQSASPSGFPSTWGFNNGSPIPADYQMDPDIVNHPLYRRKMKDALLTLRTLSLVLDLDDLFDPSTGIYSNSMREGQEWERPVSVEFIDPKGGPELQMNAGLRIQGGASRNPNRPKHNLRLLFKGIYGLTKLKFPVFDDWPVEQFDTLILRGGNGDSWFHPNTIQQIRAQYIRDQWPRDTQHEMGRLACGQGYVHLYINGLYWGLYHTIERPNASFFAEHLGGSKEDYDVVQHKGGTVDGDRQAWNAMMRIADAGLVRNEAVKEIEQYLDINNLIDFLLVNFYVGNVDWDHNNWYGGRKRETGAGFKFFTWDSERTFLNLNDNVTGKNNANQPTHVHQQLTANADYRMHFADHVHKHFFNAGALSSETATVRWMRRADEIALALSAESARWGDSKRPNDPYTPEKEWRAELNFIINEYFPQRSEIVLNQLKARNLYPNVDAPVFNINGSYQHGGLIGANDILSMTASASRGTIWYTLDGADPRQSPESSGEITDTILIAETADKHVLVPTGPIGEEWKGIERFDDADWLLCTGPPGGVGYERSSGYQDFFSLDLKEQMYNRNTTCYIRIPFTNNGSLNDFDFLTLKIRYDDGFVAYLNNVEVARRNFEDTPSWNSRAGSGHSDSEAVLFESIDLTASLGHLQQGNNLLAIHGLNVSATSSDFLISFELIAGQRASVDTDGISPSAVRYTAPITLDHSAQVKTRVLIRTTWSALNEAVFAVGPVAENLRITEIMYHPQALTEAGEPNEEFTELTNIGIETINLNLVRFTNGFDFTFPNDDLAPGEYVVVVQDRNAFEARYGATIPVAGQYTGRLNNTGERITLEDALGRTILDFRYSDGWCPLTDGEGFSLTIIDPANPDLDSWNDKDAWRASASIGGSPGQDDSGLLPNPGGVVINELLANSPGGEPDWIELYNTTEAAIDLGGWFFSDSGASRPQADNDNLFKYEIAPGTTLGPYEFLVFYEDIHFGNTNDAGSHEPFALSNNGERVILSSAQNGVPTGYREVEEFGASAPGVSFGRYYKVSTGNTNFVAMESPTPGFENAYPLVGPIVISEIMYNPDWPEDGSFTNEQYEYIELHNISAEPVTLYDSEKEASWAFTRGIDFTFPADMPVTIPAGGYLLLVKHPEAFMWRYPGVPVEKIFGPYDGKLSNAGESLELSMPGEREQDGEKHYIRIDRINYSDGSHPEDCPGLVDLWPVEADVSGLSLTRKVLTAYGNDPDNWIADVPSPGE